MPSCLSQPLEFHKWLLFVLVYIHVRVFRPDTRGEQVGGHGRVMRPLNLHATSLVIVGIRFLYSSRLLVMWYSPGERSAAVRRAVRSVLTYFTDISLSSSFSCCFVDLIIFFSSALLFPTDIFTQGRTTWNVCFVRETRQLSHLRLSDTN